MTNRNPAARACSRHHGPDCRYLTAALSCWCTNKQSIHARGTTIPGVIDCPYYQPEEPEPWVSEWELGFFLVSVATLIGVVLALLFCVFWLPGTGG